MMITVARFSFPHEAYIARAKLEAESIPASIADEYTVTQWLYLDRDGVKLQVPEKFVTRACAVLARDDSALVEQVLATKAIADTLSCPGCPQCGSNRLQLEASDPIGSLGLALLLLFPLRAGWRLVKCSACGYSEVESSSDIL